jgi:hypothetical protein
MQETMACVEVGTALGYIDGCGDGLTDRMRRVVRTLVRLAC